MLGPSQEQVASGGGEVGVMPAYFFIQIPPHHG